jgi:O-antigen ligase
MNRLTIKDMSSIDRYYMWQAGLEMIRDRPIFGQGPGMIPAAYRVYRWPEAPQTEISHLHNNVLQVAAERGLPALLFWLWWVASVMGDAYREARRRLDWAPLGACGVFVALLMAGMFEYNFGDSEVLYLALIAAAWPYALRRQREQAT